MLSEQGYRDARGSVPVVFYSYLHRKIIVILNTNFLFLVKNIQNYYSHFPTCLGHFALVFGLIRRSSS